jgi:hypothetical protein
MTPKLFRQIFGALWIIGGAYNLLRAPDLKTQIGAGGVAVIGFLIFFWGEWRGK